MNHGSSFSLTFVFVFQLVLIKKTLKSVGTELVCFLSVHLFIDLSPQFVRHWLDFCLFAVYLQNWLAEMIHFHAICCTLTLVWWFQFCLEIFRWVGPNHGIDQSRWDRNYQEVQVVITISPLCMHRLMGLSTKMTFLPHLYRFYTHRLS